MKPRIYKHSDVAKVLGVSRATVYNWQDQPFTRPQIEAKLDQMADNLNRAEDAWKALNDRMDAEERLKNV